ncbi:hypothetical protein RvY_00162 [Ramazzottius varieornatus]|uniref:Uncharacterized protein n=1 Tax=Ramazzottius varieornatus TaxID=947166 RepID=A0A1D1ULQ9_RAMVA|nr:hypothetical protein RvY_00162 [Ramazzottius varieornatus]
MLAMNLTHVGLCSNQPGKEPKPHVHFVVLIAYNREAVAAATDIAIREVQKLYASNITFTYSTYWNTQSFCDEFDSATTAYLADFYYVTRLLLSEWTHPIILATGKWLVPFEPLPLGKVTGLYL